MELENIAGQVTISGSFSGTLNFKNLAKPLQFEGTRNTELSVQAVPGRITMDLGEFNANDVVGPMRLVSRARDIKLEQFTHSLEVETERGDIEMTPGKLPLAAIEARSGSGKIELLLPEKASFQLRCDRGEGRRGQRFRTADPEAIRRAQRDAEGQSGRRPEHQDYGQSRLDLGAQGRHPAERSAARHAEERRSPSPDAAKSPQSSQGSWRNQDVMCFRVQRSSRRRTRSSVVHFACASSIDFKVLIVNVSPLPCGATVTRRPSGWA